MKTKSGILLTFIAIQLLCSCSTNKVTYFEDADIVNNERILSIQDIRVQPYDKLFIVVNTSDPDITNKLNLPYVSQRVGQTAHTNSLYSDGMMGYIVDKNGDIEFPVLGRIHVEGMTRIEVADYLKRRLSDKGAAIDARIVVEYMNLMYSVIGEVNAPGRYSIDRDVTTIIDAISQAGDLSITGLRDDILVFRQEDGVQKVYHVDLTNTKELMDSPVYYIQQNDFIYVRPNKMRERQSTLNGNTMMSTSFWISLASLATSVIVLIKNW